MGHTLTKISQEYPPGAYRHSQAVFLSHILLKKKNGITLQSALYDLPNFCFWCYTFLVSVFEERRRQFFSPFAPLSLLLPARARRGKIKIALLITCTSNYFNRLFLAWLKLVKNFYSAFFFQPFGDVFPFHWYVLI